MLAEVENIPKGAARWRYWYMDEHLYIASGNSEYSAKRIYCPNSSCTVRVIGNAIKIHNHYTGKTHLFYRS